MTQRNYWCENRLPQIWRSASGIFKKYAKSKSWSPRHLAEKYTNMAKSIFKNLFFFRPAVNHVYSTVWLRFNSCPVFSNLPSVGLFSFISSFSSMLYSWKLEFLGSLLHNIDQVIEKVLSLGESQMFDFGWHFLHSPCFGFPARTLVADCSGYRLGDGCATSLRQKSILL